MFAVSLQSSDDKRYHVFIFNIFTPGRMSQDLFIGPVSARNEFRFVRIRYDFKRRLHRWSDCRTTFPKMIMRKSFNLFECALRFHHAYLSSKQCYLSALRALISRATILRDSVSVK